MADPGSLWSETALREAALAHLALYPTTAAGLERVLLRRFARAFRAANGEREVIAADTARAQGMVRTLVERLVAAGVVDDAAFAIARARRLARGGKSRRVIAAHLAAHGVTSTVIEATLPDTPATELTACLVFARRRKIGPFRGEALADDAARTRELAACARAGFPAAIARRALALERGVAEEQIRAGARSAP